MALTLPRNFIVRGSEDTTYLHSSIDNFSNTLDEQGLMSDLRNLEKQAQNKAVTELKEIKAAFVKYENKFVDDMYKLGLYDGKGSKRDAVLKHFDKIKNADKDASKIIGAIANTKKAFADTAKQGNEKEKTEKFNTLIDKIDELLGILDKAHAKEGAFYQSLMASGYEEHIKKLKAFRNKYTKGKYKKSIYDEQGQAAINLGVLLEPALVAGLHEGLQRFTKNLDGATIGAKNIGKTGQGTTTADIKISLSTKNKKETFGIDVKSNKTYYKNRRMYQVSNIINSSNIKSDLNILRYVSFNFFNLAGSFSSKGVFTKIYRSLRKIFFYHLFYNNLKGAGMKGLRPEYIEEVIIMTPESTYYFSDFIQYIIEQVESGKSIGNMAKMNLMTLRHGDYNDKKGELVSDNNSLRGKHYRAKLKALKHRKNQNVYEGYDAIVQNADVKDYNKRIIKDIVTNTKTAINIHINTESFTK